MPIKISQEKVNKQLKELKDLKMSRKKMAEYALLSSCVVSLGRRTNAVELVRQAREED
jgi:arginine repressor